ncbi:MAG: hypothetical protein ACI97K_002381 [Glaciecola sp.]
MANTSGFSLHAATSCREIFANADDPGKLAALIPPPRINLTRFFGVFAPNSNLRAQVTASKCGKNSPKLINKEDSQCEKCQTHNVTIIACIIEPAIINKILAYLDKYGSAITRNDTRAPPLDAAGQTVMFDDVTIQRDADFGA